MKNQITIAQVALLIGSSIFFITASAQQDHKQNKKEPQQKESKHHPQQKRMDKADNGKDKKLSEKEVKIDNNKNDNGKRTEGKDEKKNNNGNNDATSRGKMKDGYKWDKESFKERKNYRNSEKVTICHKFERAGEAPVSISVSSNALKAHLNHGDVQGDCRGVNKDKLSDNFLRRRTDYYNTVENNHEQINYSRSILDYALERLSTSRQQLALMQKSNRPPADIQRKQAVVVELEQNASLLQTLIGVAGNLVANKLQ